MAPETFGIDRDMTTWQCMIALAGWIEMANPRLVPLMEEEGKLNAALGAASSHGFNQRWEAYAAKWRERRDLQRVLTKAKLLHSFFATVNDSISLYADEVSWPTS